MGRSTWFFSFSDEELEGSSHAVEKRLGSKAGLSPSLSLFLVFLAFLVELT